MNKRELIKLLPDEVPYLSEDDMCKGRFKHMFGFSSKKCCLIGWAREISNEIVKPFHVSNFMIEKVLITEIQKEIYESFSNKDWEKYTDINVAQFNDKHSLKTNARVFNNAMKRLGYKYVIEG